MTTTLESTVYGMFQEGTGSALCDSGGIYGRHWQRNQLRTLADFQSELEVQWSEHGYYLISTFHYLIKAAGLDLDETCQQFNQLPCENWDGETYGISADQTTWLEDRGFTFGASWNTYNGETSLTQVLQGTNLECGGEHYVLIQLHQGCDVRGGYTDARLFRKQAEYLGLEDVYGSVTRQDGTVISVDNRYNGYGLTDEDGNDLEISETDKVELELSEFCY